MKSYEPDLLKSRLIKLNEMTQLDELAHRKSTSITHRHIISIVNSIMSNKISKSHIRILDAGCGQAKLLKYLHEFLPQFNPNITFEVFGYDISDHGVQEGAFFEETLGNLKLDFPNVAWHERLKIIVSNDTWPFENDFFDIVISNQVLEHVWDHNFFFHENNRVLCPEGISIHLFPVKEVIMDGHLFLPFVHKFKNWNFTYNFIRFCSILGFGKYKKELSISEFTEAHTDYMFFFCNYPTYRYFARMTKQNGFRLTTKFSFNFYKRKLKEILRLENEFQYDYFRSSSVFSFHILKYISSVTFILEKEETYKKWLIKNKLIL